MTMRKYYHFLSFICLLSLAGCGETDSHDYKNTEKRQEKKGEEVMTSASYIDPKIDMNSKKTVSIIIEFKTKPAKVAVALAKANGVSLTLEEAEQNVEDSHARFQKDVKRFLDQKQIPYSITHTYKSALNGVAMELPANEIKALLQSTEINAIYTNQEFHLDPPPQPTYLN
ncbi:protease inhibitor I9 family protein [Bacillus sp. FJAT-53711]|uniref:Protease inhibitor I9 family protein n=1 Tax=Bacillus yunxiaonensis TaxID=3127665 RepID=A0ABU8FZR1_9BACI